MQDMLCPFPLILTSIKCLMVVGQVEIYFISKADCFLSCVDACLILVTSIFIFRKNFLYIISCLLIIICPIKKHERDNRTEFFRGQLTVQFAFCSIYDVFLDLFKFPFSTWSILSN